MRDNEPLPLRCLRACGDVCQNCQLDWDHGYTISPHGCVTRCPRFIRLQERLETGEDRLGERDG